MDRQQVFELIRDRLADILEIEPARHLRGRKLRRRPRGRLARPDRAGRGPRGGAQRALRRLPDRRRGPRGPEDGARRRRLRRRPAVGAPISLPVPRLAQLVERLGLDLAPDLLAPALVHRSWCAENAGHPSNERLEFLGDAVLGVVVTDHVYRVYPDLDEGALTEIRKTVVNSVALAEVAEEPRRRRPPAARQGRGALRRAREAVDPGRRPGGDHRRRLPRRRAGGAPRSWCSASSGAGSATAQADGADHKSRLQELSAHLFGTPPRYEVEASGPDHARTFFVTATIGGDGLRPGRGPLEEAGRAGRRARRGGRAWSTTQPDTLRETHHG